MKSVDSLKKKKETTHGKSALEKCIDQELLWQSGRQLWAGICLHTAGSTLPSPDSTPTPNLFLLQLFSPAKTPESLINYKHASSSVCRRQISVLAVVSIPLVP